MKTVYAIPTYNCNLNCPHCDIHKRKIQFNEEKFIKTLIDIHADSIVLFGGEPFLNKDVLKKCIETNKINSISTNLLLLDDDIFNLIQDYNISLATSWNPKRFTTEQYKLWLNNLSKFKNTNTPIDVLITMTDDLITMSDERLLKILSDIDYLESVDGIVFEHLLDNNLDNLFHQRCDEWLCKIHNLWKFKLKNVIEERVLNWNNNCSDIWTLEPTGELRFGCPQYIGRKIVDKCLTCELVSKCKPCMLQKHCSFPKKLYEVLSNG